MKQWKKNATLIKEAICEAVIKEERLLSGDAMCEAMEKKKERCLPEEGKCEAVEKKERRQEEKGICVGSNGNGRTTLA